MEIERDVKIEKGGDLEKLEVGFLSGPRVAEALPEFSEDELKQELGHTLTARIRKLFRSPAEVGRQSPPQNPPGP